jgi:hypothetical protein
VILQKRAQSTAHNLMIVSQQNSQFHGSLLPEFLVEPELSTSSPNLGGSEL